MLLVSTSHLYPPSVGGHDDVSKDRDNWIITSLSNGLGDTRPWADRISHDVNATSNKINGIEVLANRLEFVVSKNIE